MSNKECCANCDWFALEPGKRRTGACLYRWMPTVIYAAGGKPFSAYGRTFPWETCKHWTEKGTIKRLEPEVP